MTVEHVYSGHDNIIKLLLKEDGEAVDLSSVTRITMSFGTTEIDTSDAGTTLTTDGTFDLSEGSSGILSIRLGDQEIESGAYGSEIVIYDATNDNGVVWGEVKIIVE